MWGSQDRGQWKYFKISGVALLLVYGCMGCGGMGCGSVGCGGVPRVGVVYFGVVSGSVGRVGMGYVCIIVVWGIWCVVPWVW